MKYKRIAAPPTKPREELARSICDFCGEEEDIGVRVWDETTIRLEAKIGDIFPEVDTRRVEVFDCCESCWEKKVVPALKALGGKLYEYDSDEGRLPKMPFEPARAT